MSGWDYTDIKTWSWDKHPEGACIPTGGTAADYSVAGWRTEHPVWIEEKCTQCGTCFIYCPDSAIARDIDKGEMTGFDYDACKGCGICAAECPRDAIRMEHEGGDE